MAATTAVLLGRRHGPGYNLNGMQTSTTASNAVVKSIKFPRGREGQKRS